MKSVSLFISLSPTDSVSLSTLTHTDFYFYYPHFEVKKLKQ